MAAVVLSACTSQRPPVASPVSPPETFSTSGADDVPERWWTVFDDDALDAVVDTALEANLDLKQAWERLRAAEAVVDRESAALLPDLEGFVLGDARRSSRGAAEQSDLRLGLSSVYEVDLWGRIRSDVEAEQLRSRASLADYRAATLSLAAEIVRAWYRLAEARLQLDILDQQVATNVDMLNLLERRFGAGQIRSVDILRQRQLVEASREQRTYALARLRVLEHQLAVLSGRAPQQVVENPPETLPILPPLPETGIPVDLVRRRPDVQRALSELRAADRDLASAISNQYPRLTLSLSGSSATASASNLFRDWAGSFAGDLIAPLFYGGEFGAEVDRNEAVVAERTYAYGQAVLVALQEVEDALDRELSQTESVQRIAQQVDLADQAYEQLRVQYFNGATSYLEVLTALDDVQRLRRDLVAAELNLLEYRIALYRALAGPFETTRELHD